MAHNATSTSEKHSSATKRIWTVFLLLSIVTIIEVVLGITKPDSLIHIQFIRMKLLNWIFIILTIYKAYLITWAFMHMEHETKGLRRSVVWTAVFLISYLVFIILTEGDYVHNVLHNGFVSWDF